MLGVEARRGVGTFCGRGGAGVSPRAPAGRLPRGGGFTGAAGRGGSAVEPLMFRNLDPVTDFSTTGGGGAAGPACLRLINSSVSFALVLMDSLAGAGGGGVGTTEGGGVAAAAGGGVIEMSGLENPALLPLLTAVTFPGVQLLEIAGSAGFSGFSAGVSRLQPSP